MKFINYFEEEADRGDLKSPDISGFHKKIASLICHVTTYFHFFLVTLYTSAKNSARVLVREIKVDSKRNVDTELVLPKKTYSHGTTL